jgi:hypothetical protein
MEIKPTYVTFEQAKRLKEKGFDIDCKKYSSDGIGTPISGFVHQGVKAPEQWQVVEWLRVKHGIHIAVNLDLSNTQDFDFRIQKPNYLKLSEKKFKTPQQAYSVAFDYILNNSPKIAIICLTSWARFELGDNKSGRIHQCLPNQKEVAFFYKKYWNPYLEYSNLLRHILSLQCVAQVKSTKLYFLDTFNDNLNKNPSYEWFTDTLKMGDAFSKMDDERLKILISKKTKYLCVKINR